MALMQLITRTLSDNYFRQRVESREHRSILFQNNRFLISRIGDVFNPRTFIFQNVSTDFKFESFTMSIGNSSIFERDVDILKNVIPRFLSTHTHNNQTTHLYKFPLDEIKFRDLIKIISLQHHEIDFTISYQGTFSQAELFGEYIYLDNQDRSDMAQGQFQNKFLEMASFTHQITNQQTTITLPFINGLTNGLTNGFILHGLSELEQVTLKLNGNQRLSYNRWQLIASDSMINENTYYLSLGNPEIFSDNFEMALNLSRIDNITLELTTTQINQNIKIACLIPNILQVRNGMALNKFTWSTGTLSSGVNISHNVPVPSTNINWLKVNKLLEGDSYCCVNLMEIHSNNEYLNCEKCHKNFLLPITKQYVDTKHKCPHCKQGWDNSYKKIYVNSN